MSSVESSAQSSERIPAQHFLTYNLKFSKTIFGEPVDGEGVLGWKDPVINFYTPGGFGMGGEVIYEKRRGVTAWSVSLAMTNLKFQADRIFNYDVYREWQRSYSLFFLESQALAKRYISLGSCELDLHIGLVGNRYILNMFRRPDLRPKSWGIQILAGSSLLFPVNDNLAFVAGARFTYQVNKFHEYSNFTKEFYKIKRPVNNNCALHFTFGAKCRLGAKKEGINTGRFPMN